MNLSTARMMNRLLTAAQEELDRVDLTRHAVDHADNSLAGMGNARLMLTIAQDELLATIVEQEPKP